MNAPTPEEVAAFAAHMTYTFDAEIAEKREALPMRAAAKFLSAMGILDQEEFLASYATTIVRSLYLPFTPGQELPEWPLWSQISTIAHECQHVVQYERLGALRFARDYLTTSEGRAVLEAEAYRTNVELYHWRSGDLPDTDKIAAVLAHYGCDEKDVAFVQQHLALSAISIEAGAIVNRASSAAIEWLKSHAPHLGAEATATSA